ncbi:MAG: hypothetical protein Q9227_005060 [Pyrenula ochraceoflavens]
MTEVPKHRANYRYYCDGDPQDPDGGTRWTLRPDPISAPQDYVRQEDREQFDPDIELEHQIPYQEWEDISDGVMMGASIGCQNEDTEAEEFHVQTHDDGGGFLIEPVHLPPIRAAIIDDVPYYGRDDQDGLDSQDSQDSPGGQNGLAYGWKAVQDLSATQSLKNVDNVVYFALLATLADRGFRLFDQGVYQGRLVWDPAVSFGGLPL